MKNSLIIIIVISSLTITDVWGQKLRFTKEELDTMSIETVLKLNFSKKEMRAWNDLHTKAAIESASKQEEDVFEAPSASNTIKRSEIIKSGATSIPEALRLSPDLLVRETTPGNYDIHIRGLNNLIPGSSIPLAANNILLVMIDNRPIYNYGQGGVYWESLPIDINDVERIEVVRGASSALFGPNAVAGVINIITRKPDKEGIYVVSNMQIGSNSTVLPNAAIGYKFSDKFSAVVSGNFQKREREDDRYYDYFSGTYKDASEFNLLHLTTAELLAQHSTPKVSLDKYGANAYLNYTPKENVEFNLSFGMEETVAQKVFMANSHTPISQSESSTQYMHLQAKAKGLTSTLSYLRGTQNSGVGISIPIAKSDINVVDFITEYNFKFLDDHLLIKPGFSYRLANSDDRPYIPVGAEGTGALNQKAELTTVAASLRADYLYRDFRFIAAARWDSYNKPSTNTLSYQLVASYNLNNEHLWRAVAARAYRGPFMFETFVNAELSASNPFFGNPATNLLIPNNNYELMMIDLYEIGYRSNMIENFQLDVSLFTQNVNDYNSLVAISQPGASPSISQPLNIPLEIRQVGATLALNVLFSKVQFKPFVTWQKTTLDKLSPNMYIAGTNPLDPSASYLNTIDNVEHEGTPSLFGGFILNVEPMSKLNVNLNAYFFGKHRVEGPFTYRIDAILFDANTGSSVVANNKAEIESKFLLNAKVLYQVADQLGVFISGRNLLNQDSFEYLFSDQIGTTFFGGINFDF